MDYSNKTKEELISEIEASRNRINELERLEAEHAKAEAEVRALKQRIEFILGATRTGLDIIDSAYNMVYIDPEWKKIYGEPAGRKCYEYYASRSSVCPGCGIPKAMETKKTVVTEEVLPKEGGRPIQVTTIPFQDEKGNWLVAEVNVDISERKRVERELEGKVRDMERFQKVVLNRELKMIELKEKIKELEAKLGGGGISDAG